MATLLNGLVPRMVERAFRRRGFHEPALLTEWAAIVGPAMAAETQPIKIAHPRGERTRGALHVRVTGAYALELQHTAPLVIERLNAYYGYAALERLVLHQGPVGTMPGRHEKRRPEPGESTRGRIEGFPAPAALDGIEDDRLKAALRGLGGSIRRESRAG